MLQTKIYSYCFNIIEPEQAEQYRELCDRLTAQGIEFFENYGNGSHYLGWAKGGRDIELETKHIFSNQWNTAPIDGDKGHRVFDWAQDYPINIGRNIKRGHYIEQTAEMAEVRQNTVCCGYCGHQEPAQKGNVFCGQCLGSEYLKEADLKLLRLLPAEQHLPKRPELTDAEKAHLMPLYVTAQTEGEATRISAYAVTKQRADIKARAAKAINSAKTERDGFIWLLDHGVNIDNCIYYSHKNLFSFGWRNPVAEAVKSSLLDILVEFPFEYEIKSEAAA